jgi:hypothetical protein
MKPGRCSSDGQLAEVTNFFREARFEGNEWPVSECLLKSSAIEAQRGARITITQVAWLDGAPREGAKHFCNPTDRCALTSNDVYKGEV